MRHFASLAALFCAALLVAGVVGCVSETDAPVAPAAEKPTAAGTVEPTAPKPEVSKPAVPPVPKAPTSGGAAGLIGNWTIDLEAM